MAGSYDESDCNDDERSNHKENSFASSSTSRISSTRTSYKHHKSIRVSEFTDKNNFALWKGEVSDAYIDMIEALEEEKSDDMTIREWGLMNLKACGNIKNYLCPSIKHKFQKETNASELWKKLEEKYAKKTMQNKLHPIRKLFGLDMKPEMSLEDHLPEFTNLCEDLLNMDEIIPETYKALCLLNSLSDKYENLVDLLLKGKNDLDCNEIEVELLNHTFRKEDKREQKGESSAAVLFTQRQDRAFRKS